jgi:hypothetical protein
MSTVTSVESLRKQAKQWLKALRAGDPAARARLAAAHPGAGEPPTLRDVQHALARERGFAGWSALVAATTTDREPAVRALLEAALRGDAAAVDDLLARNPDIFNERRVLPGHSGLRAALHYAVTGPQRQWSPACSRTAPTPTCATRATPRRRCTSPPRSSASA